MPKLPFNPISQTSYFLKSRFQLQDLSTATAFFVTRNSKRYLITNLHVVSGRDPKTGQCLSKSGGIPDNLLLRLHMKQSVIEFADFEVKLVDDNDNDKPNWLEHPNFGSAVDVVALQVSIPSTLSALDVEDFIEPLNEDTEESVAEDVFVIGYPFGTSVAQIFPIWKRASIASEPIIDVDDLPKMLIDTASRSGMSGSPVLLLEERHVGRVKGDPNSPDAVFSHNRMKLIGVYSGRIGVDELNFKAQLGIVWKGRVIDEIISQGN